MSVPAEAFGSQQPGVVFEVRGVPELVIWRAKWWQRPWLWLRCKPTRSEHYEIRSVITR